MKSKHAFTLVELLVVIAIIAVLLAILLPSLRNARALAHRLTCRSRLSGIGKNIAIYADQYDGKLPAPASDNPAAPGIKTPYEVCIDSDHLDTTPNVWMNLGCLYKAQLIPSGRELYCPAHAEGLAEFEKYQLAPDGITRIPWGTTPNLPTYTSTWWHVETKAGYAFWPQSRYMLTQLQYDAISARGENPSARYIVGYPATPAKYSDMNPNKSLAADYCPHSIRGSGWNLQVVFGDSHVNMQKVPVDPVTGKFWYPYQAKPPEGEPVSQWVEIIPTAKYFYVLQP